MRQGNGSDLLGANDPRSATIGIIYVASNDDRESVLAAILTQEKLGRKQIALVLPNQNRAFQRPVDFDGLKNMRRKLQAQLIIIAPQGSGPAEFARQRRFPFYSSIVNYKESLQEENEASRASRRGGWLGLGNQKLSTTDNDVDDLTPPSNVGDFSGREPRDPHAADPNINAAAMGLGMGAAGYEAGRMMDAHYDENDETPMPTSAHYGNEEDEDLMLSPGGSPQQGSYRDEDDMGAPPPLVPGAVVDADLANMDTHPLSPQADNAGNQPVPPIIPLPLPDDDEYDDEGPPSPLPLRRGNTGPRPAVVASAPVIVPHSGTTGGNYAGGTPPPVIVPGGGGNAGRPPRQRRSGWQLLLIALIALLLLSLLLCGGIALAAPGTLGSFSNAMSHFIPGVVPPSATVTITPKTQDLTNSYVLTGVTTGTPDVNKRQVQARVLTYTPSVKSNPAKATGTTSVPATQSHGKLTFYNALTFAQTVGAGTTFTLTGGVKIVTDQSAFLSAASPPTESTATVNAHSVTVGSNGNIRAFTLNGACCLTGVTVQNTQAFFGGQDASTYTSVQQSDIDGVVKSLKEQFVQSALATISGKKNPNEQFLPNQPQCPTNVTSNPALGQKATTFVVTITASCTGEVYDLSGPNGVQAVAENILKGEASADITKNDPTANPADYALQENTFVAKVTQATVDKKNGNVILQVNAEGIWVYQYTPAKLAQLKTLIAGQSITKATSSLEGTAGVKQVNGIVLSDNSSTLPTDVNLINIVVKQIPGVQGTPTVTPGTPGGGTPTPVGTLTSPVATPAGTPPGK